MTWRTGAGQVFRQDWLLSVVLSVFALAACGDDDTTKSLSVVDPMADQELSLADDDVDSDSEGLQYDVTVESSGLVEGTPLRLLVDDKQVAEGEVGEGNKTVLSGVTLEPGRKTIVAQTLFAEITSDKEQQYVYRMLRIASPVAGTVDEDADATTDGMQVAISVEAFAIDDEVTLIVDGDEQEETSAVTEGTASFVATLSAGRHTLSAKSGEVEAEPVQIVVLRSCGAITLVSPKPTAGKRVVLGGSDGSCPGAEAPYTSNFEVSTDVGDGLTARLFVNDMMAATATVEDTVVNFEDVALNMRTSASTLKVEIDHPDGTCSKSFDLQVFVDCAGPDCEVISPVARAVTERGTTTQYLNSSMGDGTFTVEVASSADLVGSEIELIVDGDSADPLTADAARDGSAAKASFDVDLPDGSHRVRARCVDEAGNVTLSAERRWMVDITPCTVAVASPSADAKIILADDEDPAASGTQSLLTANVTGSDCSEARASVCDTGSATGSFAAYAPGSPFTITLDDGRSDQSLCVDVMDKAGNTGSASVDVQYFSSNPVVEILSPVAGAKYNTTGDDSLTEEFEQDEDPATAGCQADFRVQCSEIGLPVELVRVPSLSTATEVVLATADCNEPAASDTDIDAGFGVAVFNTISFQDPSDFNPTYLARQNYAGDSGDQLGESAGISVSGQCTALTLTYRSDLRTSSGVRPLSTCPARVRTTGVTIDVYATAAPAQTGLSAVVVPRDADGNEVALTGNDTITSGGIFNFINRGISVGSTMGMASVTVEVTDPFNNQAQISCAYNVSDSNLMLNAGVASPPGTTTISASTPDNAACSNTAAASPARFRVPLVLTADVDSVAAAAERTLVYQVNGATAVPVPLSSSGSVLCVEVDEGASNIMARLDDTNSVDFDMQLVSFTVDTLNLTAPAQGATLNGASPGCGTDEVQVTAAVHPFYPNGEPVTITTGAGSVSATISGGTISQCVAVATGVQNVTVTIPRTGATQTSSITVNADPTTDAITFTATLPDEATYRTDPVDLDWSLPSGTFGFTTAELRCSDTALATSDATAKDTWWAAATTNEHRYVDGSSRFAAAAGLNPVSGTFDMPTGGRPLECVLRLCDGASRCTAIPDASVTINKPFRRHSITGTIALGNMGRQLEPVGDINGDGRADALIAAPASSTGTPAVHLLFGTADAAALRARTTPNVTISLSVTTEATSFGSAIAGLGDFNGDGRPDFAVGRPYASGGTGRVYVFFGRASTDTWPASIALSDTGCEADLCITHSAVSGTAASSLGISLAGLGNFDGQGPNDFAIGAPGTGTLRTVSGTSRAEGAVYIVAGDSSLGGCSNATCDNRGGEFWGLTANLSPGVATNLSGFYIEAPESTQSTGAFFGAYVSAAGNADGSANGLDDLVVLANLAQEVHFLTGRTRAGSGLTTLASSASSLIPIPFAAGRIPAGVRLLADVFDPGTGPSTVGMPDLALFFGSNNDLHVLAGDTTVGFNSSRASVLQITGITAGGATVSGFGTGIAGGRFPALNGTGANGLPDFDLDGDGAADLFIGSRAAEHSGTVGNPGGAFYFDGDAILRKTAATPPVGLNPDGAGPLPRGFAVSRATAASNVAQPVVTSDPTYTQQRQTQYVGDLTGDGIPDLLVGDVPRTSSNPERAGGFWILY